MSLAIVRGLVAGALCLVALNVGCSSPSHPTPTPTPTPPADPGPLALSSIQPTSGSTFGSTVVRLIGTGFTAGATVRIDGTLTTAAVFPKEISLKMPAHSAGPVDVVVTLTTGESATLSQAYSYVHVDSPVITSISPNVGSTGGEVPLEITGTGFQPGATLALGGVVHEIDVGSAGMFTYTKAHVAGSVDVVVTNPDGQFDTVIGGYTFVPPGSLDFNGTWQGLAFTTSGPGQPMEFTIRGNVLVGLSCGGRSDIVLSPSPEVSGGQFFFRGAAGSISGGILSPVYSEGRIDIPPCPNSTIWYAEKTLNSK